MATKNISLKKKRQDPNLVEIKVKRRSFFISKASLAKIEEEYLKEQEEKKKNPRCFSGSYADSMSFVSINETRPFGMLY